MAIIVNEFFELCRVVFKTGLFVVSKTDRLFWLIVKEEHGFLFEIEGVGSNAVMAGKVQTLADPGAGWLFDAQALGPIGIGGHRYRRGSSWCASSRHTAIAPELTEMN